MKLPEESALEYPQLKADIDLCYNYLFAICRGEKLALTVPPQKDNYDMQMSAAFDELKAYRDSGLSPKEIVELKTEAAQGNVSEHKDIIKIECIQEQLDKITAALSLFYYQDCGEIKKVFPAYNSYLGFSHMFERIEPTRKAWRADTAGCYYYITEYCEVCCCYERRLAEDDRLSEAQYRHASGNYFQDKSKAEAKAKKVRKLFLGWG